MSSATLVFFESGPGMPPIESRIYADSFDSRSARFINWQLDLTFPTPGVPLTLPMEAFYRRPDGSTYVRQELTAKIEADWVWFRIENGRGAKDSGTWHPGRYTVQVFLGGTPVATASFLVR